MLAPMGVALVLNADPSLSVYWVGEMPLEDLPGVIRSQTGCVLVKRGRAWMVSDPEGDSVPMTAAAGAATPVSMVGRSSVSGQIAADQLLASLSNVRVEVCIVDASASLSVQPSQTSLTADLFAAKVAAVVVEGGRFSVRDTEQRSIPKTDVVGTSGTVVTSGLIETEAGLIFGGQCRNLGGKFEVVGNLELSRFTDTLRKTQRVLAIELLLGRGEAVEVATLDSGELGATIAKRFGFTAGGRKLKVMLRVR